MSNNIIETIKSWAFRNWLIAIVFVLASITIFVSDFVEGISKISTLYRKSKLHDTVATVAYIEYPKPSYKSNQPPEDIKKTREDALNDILYDFSIMTSPMECEVYIDSSFSGLTNKTLFLKKGEYEVKIAKEGYKAVKDMIEISDSGTLRVYELTPL